MENQEQLEPTTATEPQDIEPGQWLAASKEVPTETVEVKGGRIKLAALTEKESDQLRRLAERINPSNPRGPKLMDLKKMRIVTACASINKAYGYTPSDPRFLRPEQLEEALTGELTMINKKIAEISGYKEDSSADSEAVFQIS